MGELLALPPAWPREWSQRIGQEASKLGGRTEVRRRRTGEGWEIRWTLDQRPLLTLRPTPAGVEVEMDIPESSVRAVLADPSTDEEFARELQAVRMLRGRRRLCVPIGSARRANTVSLVVRVLARVGSF